MTNPRVSAYVVIPDDCPMSVTFAGDRDVEVLLGCRFGGFEMIFERDALKRLIEVGHKALAVLVPDDPKADMPMLTSAAVN